MMWILSLCLLITVLNMITLFIVLKDNKDAGVPFIIVIMFSWYFPVWQEDDEAGEEEK